MFALLGKNPLTALYVYFVEPLTDALSPAGDRGEGDAAGADRDRPVALLPRQCLEHRRRRANSSSARCAAAGSRSSTHGTDAGRWVLPAMLVLGALGGALYGADPGASAGCVRRQRDPDQPDAGLCRRPAARLSGARAVARSEGLQLPDHRRVRQLRDHADPDRGQPPASRRRAGAHHRRARRRHARAHHQGLRDPRRRRRAACRRASPASTPTGWCW